MNKFIQFNLLIAWIFFIAAATLLPLPDLGGTGSAWRDKLAHFLLFGGLSFFLLRFFKAFSEYDIRGQIVVSVCASALYAVLIEYLQSFIPGRSASVFDFLAGAVGALAVAGFFWARRVKNP